LLEPIGGTINFLAKICPFQAESSGAKRGKPPAAAAAGQFAGCNSIKFAAHPTAASWPQWEQMAGCAEQGAIPLSSRWLQANRFFPPRRAGRRCVLAQAQAGRHTKQAHLWTQEA